MADRIQLRGDTSAAWTLANPVLAQRELAFEIDTGKTKLGDGMTAWNALPYGGIVGPVGPQGAKGDTGDTGPQGTTAWGDLTGKPSVFPSDITNVSGLESRLSGSTAEINFGSVGKHSGRFVIPASGMTAEKRVSVRLAGGLCSGKGPTHPDEHELMGQIAFVATAAANEIRVFWQSAHRQIGAANVNWSY